MNCCPLCNGLYHEKEMAEIKIDYLFVFTNGFNYLAQLSAVPFFARLFGVKQKAYDVHVPMYTLISFFPPSLNISYKLVKANMLSVR